MPDRPDLVSGEPRPPELPCRYAPDIPFPSYRHVPGLTPHPRQDPRGHSHGKAEPDAILTPPEDWRSCRDYLHAVDLYNAAYWWESHETLESLWIAAGKASSQAIFFQGIIQAAAANIKWHLKNEGAASFLAKEAGKKLEKAASEGEQRYMGLDVTAFAQDLVAFHVEGGGRDPSAWPPLIVLDP